MAPNYSAFSKKYICESDKIPKQFVGYTIAHISDIANNPLRCYEVVEGNQPDIVVITGNLSDTDGNYSESLDTVASLVNNYKVLYVLGENDASVAKELNDALVNLGAINIENYKYSIESPKISYDEFVAEFIEDKYIEQAKDASTDAYAYLQYTYKALQEDANKNIIITGLSVMDDSTDFISAGYDVIELNHDIFQGLVFNQTEYLKQLSQISVDFTLSGNTYGRKVANGYSRGVYNVNGKTSFVNPGSGKISDGGFRSLINMANVYIITLSDGTINTNNPLETFIAKFSGEKDTRFDRDQGFFEYRAKDVN